MFIRNCSMLKCKRIYEDLAPSVVCNTSSRVQKSHQSICQYVHMISLPSGQQNYAEQINPILNVSIQLISACTERQEINLFRISPLYFSGDFTQDAAVISINCSFLPQDMFLEFLNLLLMVLDGNRRTFWCSIAEH